MRRAYSELFHLSPESWLGRKLDADTQLVVSPKVALTFECRMNKGESLSAALQSSLDGERAEIDTMSEEGVALRADRIEALHVRECGGSANPSVDICIRAGSVLMLVECKYKALPETSIVKDIETFNSKVARKFDASQTFYRHEGAHQFYDERIVLFNGDSVDKVLSMFKRLLLEEDDEGLNRYVITDTQGFHSRYWKMVVGEGMKGERKTCLV